jgi:hypothetical protein
VPLRVKQELLKAFDELEATGKPAPALRHPLVVGAKLRVCCVSRSRFSSLSALERIRDMRAKFLKHTPIPLSVYANPSERDISTKES